MSELKLQDKLQYHAVPVTIIAGAIVLLVVLVGVYISSQQYKAVDPEDQREIHVQLPDQSSARQIAAILKEHDLIRSEKAFLRYCRKNNLDSHLKAGSYVLKRSQSLPEMAAIIARGSNSGKITVPEGYTLDQIGQLFIQNKICTPKEFEQALLVDYPYDFIPGEASNPKRLEGYLFPDTYAVSPQTSPEQLIATMLERFSTIWNQNFAEQAAEKDMSVHEVLIIASLIEREAKVPSERARISGVIQNRLAAGMPLQIDATVLYARGKHKEQVLLEDLKVDSPYNTYKYPGLPPGPIASPGRAAIEAALNPEQHDYMYYVARGDGSHFFSKTYAEHEQARKKYEKENAANRNGDKS
ncbi:MAG TPA: endolytic transglycosylase MltG [Syntrophomonadaceae bacterium]|nr:endolytic transglycosylase MltG [Syntrophomonadaceae bacterium]